MYKHIFGPVPSRRLGRSLGIDLVPLKTCSFNCLFCQAGTTTNLTRDRDEYIPLESVLSEFESWVESGGTADYITFSGSGEPTLYSRIDEVIAAVRRLTDCKIALLTNSTLLHRPEVRTAVSGVDLIKASLSAWNDEILHKVNRPEPGVTVDSIIEGIRALRSEFQGQLWIEVFLMDGINDDPAGVEQIADVLKKIGPDRVQLNTVVRPPTESTARALTMDSLKVFSMLFEPHAEIIANVQPEPLDDEVGTRPVQ